jgi:hypothetical protein
MDGAESVLEVTMIVDVRQGGSTPPYIRHSLVMSPLPPLEMEKYIQIRRNLSVLRIRIRWIRMFGPPRSGSVIILYGSGSGSGSFH